MTTASNFRLCPRLFPSVESAKLSLSRAAGAITASDDTLTVLERARVALASVETIIERVARDARDEGKTWQEVGDALGMSRQAAQERFKAV